MNDTNSNNPDFGQMSFEELYKWTFKKRFESIPHERGIFELHKRMSEKSNSIALKTLWISVITLVSVIVGIIVNLLLLN